MNKDEVQFRIVVEGSSELPGEPLDERTILRIVATKLWLEGAGAVMVRVNERVKATLVFSSETEPPHV